MLNRIDGIDISTIGLEDLRSRIVSEACNGSLTETDCLKTVISQDVALFQGTIRTNLDPFEQHSDADCLQVLERCHLTQLLHRGNPPEADISSILHLPVAKGGSFSAGERQLLALARAILRRTNIVIMDEATSQIDSRLDEQVCFSEGQRNSHLTVNQ
jgi:ABC-type multidrug transport system fused ATPase/permease subunit